MLYSFIHQSDNKLSFMDTSVYFVCWTMTELSSVFPNRECDLFSLIFHPRPPDITYEVTLFRPPLFPKDRLYRSLRNKIEHPSPLVNTNINNESLSLHLVIVEFILFHIKRETIRFYLLFVISRTYYSVTFNSWVQEDKTTIKWTLYTEGGIPSSTDELNIGIEVSNRSSFIFLFHFPLGVEKFLWMTYGVYCIDGYTITGLESVHWNG